MDAQAGILIAGLTGCTSVLREGKVEGPEEPHGGRTCGRGRLRCQHRVFLGSRSAATRRAHLMPTDTTVRTSAFGCEVCGNEAYLVQKVCSVHYVASLVGLGEGSTSSQT